MLPHPRLNEEQVQALVAGTVGSNYGPVVKWALGNDTRRIEDLLPEKNIVGRKQDFDPSDPKDIEAMLSKYNAYVELGDQDSDYHKNTYYVVHEYDHSDRIGSMDCGWKGPDDATPEVAARYASTARAAGALFLWLWYERNIQCDIARDLCRSYWDGRIGREVDAKIF